MPYGRIGSEALIKVLDLELELALHNLARIVIASIVKVFLSFYSN